MKVNDAYPSKYLQAGDVTETPQPYTIQDVNVAEIGRDRVQKLVIDFKDTNKAFVCNKTNAKTIEKALGTDETEEWIGKTIRLYSTEVQFGDEMVEAIRVSLKPGKPAPARGSAAELETGPKKGDPDFENVPGRQRRDWPETAPEEDTSEIPF